MENDAEAGEMAIAGSDDILVLQAVLYTLLHLLSRITPHATPNPEELKKIFCSLTMDSRCVSPSSLKIT